MIHEHQIKEGAILSWSSGWDKVGWYIILHVGRHYVRMIDVSTGDFSIFDYDIVGFKASTWKYVENICGCRGHHFSYLQDSRMNNTYKQVKFKDLKKGDIFMNDRKLFYIVLDMYPNKSLTMMYDLRHVSISKVPCRIEVNPVIMDNFISLIYRIPE